MKKIILGLNHKNRRIFLKVKKCSYLDEAFGLMFQKKEKAEALLFDFSGRKSLALHSYFVFFTFLAIWLDDKNKIVDIKTIKPFSFNIIPKKQFTKVVEIPISRKYSKIIKKLVGKRKI